MAKYYKKQDNEWVECSFVEYMAQEESDRKCLHNTFKSFANKKYYKKVVETGDYNLDLSLQNVTAPRGVSVAEKSLYMAFLQGNNPNEMVVTTNKENLVYLKFSINVGHNGGGDTVSNHYIKAYYKDGTSKTLVVNATAVSNGTIEIETPLEDKPFYKFGCGGTQAYNTGYNVGNNVRWTLLACKSKETNLKTCIKAEYDQLEDSEKIQVNNKLCLKCNNRAYLGGG